MSTDKLEKTVVEIDESKNRTPKGHCGTITTRAPGAGGAERTYRTSRTYCGKVVIRSGECCQAVEDCVVSSFLLHCSWLG